MNKIDFILIFDARDANPNGDPDAGNLPRTDGETEHGLVTDVCLKRKIRNYVQLTRRNEAPYEIYVKEKAILNNQNERAYQALRQEGNTPSIEDARAWMCRNFFDIRSFGAVMSTKVNCGQVRGPVQISFARSVDPVTQLEYAVTRCAVTTEDDAKAQKGDNRTMGRKFTVPYGVYLAKGTINPFLAEQTGFNEADLDVLKEALCNLFTFDASAARPAGSMAVRKLLFFKHDSELGNAPAHKLYDSVHIRRREGVECPRSFADYELSIDPMPAGVTLEDVPC